MGKKRSAAEEKPKLSWAKLALGALGATVLAALGSGAYFGLCQLELGGDLVLLLVGCVFGLLIYLLAEIGFGLLSGEKKQRLVARLICVGAVSFFAILLAVHAVEFYELYQAFLKQGMDLGEAWKAYPQWTAIKDIADPLTQRLAWACVLPAAGTIHAYAKLREEKKKYR